MAQSVESLLTRELELRFIDARNMATEARFSLGVEGYPTQDQIYQIRDEAIRIFRSKAFPEQCEYRRRNLELEAVKIPAGSRSPIARTISSTSERLSDNSHATDDGMPSRLSHSDILRGLFQR